MMANEIQIHKKMDHPYIIKLFEYFKDDERFYMVMELCSGGELYKKIIKNERIDEKTALKYIYQILMAVNYLHT